MPPPPGLELATALHASSANCSWVRGDHDPRRALAVHGKALTLRQWQQSHSQGEWASLEASLPSLVLRECLQWPAAFPFAITLVTTPSVLASLHHGRTFLSPRWFPKLLPANRRSVPPVLLPC